MVAWALEHVSAAGFDEVIVVLGAVDLSKVLGTVVIVNNPEWASGQAHSLHVGIAAAEQREMCIRDSVVAVDPDARHCDYS